MSFLLNGNYFDQCERGPGRQTKPSVFSCKVSAELKEKSLQAKTRGDEAFKNKNYMAAVDAYTQVSTQYVALNFQAYIAMITGRQRNERIADVNF